MNGSLVAPNRQNTWLGTCLHLYPLSNDFEATQAGRKPRSIVMLNNSPGDTWVCSPVNVATIYGYIEGWQTTR